MTSFGISSTHDRESILELLLHHMSQETRGLLMRELPGAYNRLCDQDIVTVVRTSDHVRIG